MVNKDQAIIRYTITRPRCKFLNDRIKPASIKQRGLLFLSYLYVNMYDIACASIATYRIRRYE
nr:MAG TPA: hypothetical protein [Caudoviricetes sp.]